MFHPIVFLGAFTVVKTLQRTNQITGDPANPLERLMPEVITAPGAVWLASSPSVR